MTIWIYPAETRDPAKQGAARAWLKRLAASNMLIVSPHVATHHHRVATRKLGLSPEIVRWARQAILDFADAPLTRRDMVKAMDLVAQRCAS
jgi:hypothetical protein